MTARGSAVRLVPAGLPALLRGGAAAFGGALGRGAALAAAFPRARVALLPAAAGARFLAAARFLVDRRPGAGARFLLGNALVLIAFGDMLGLALLLVGIFAFVALRHDSFSFRRRKRLAQEEVLRRHPLPDAALQHGQGQGAAHQHRVMEALEVEARAHSALGLRAQAGDDGLAALIGAGLARPDAIALDLAHRRAFRLRRIVDHVADRLLAAPALGVEPAVDDQPDRSEQIGLEEADPAERIALVAAELVAEMLGIERPALAIGGEAAGAAVDRQRPGLAREADLKMMAGNALMIGQRLEAHLGPFVGILEVDIVDSRPRAVERTALV